MASDWIKMRPGMGRHAKVTAMARFLCEQPDFNAWLHGDAGVTRHDSVTNSVTFEIVTRVTVASLLDVWGAINHVVKDDDRVHFMTLADVDRLAGVPRFGEAMQSVDWIETDDAEGLVFPNFHEFNTPEAKRSKAKTGAQRAREYRERKKAEQGGETTRNERHVTSRRVEESREEVTSQPRANAPASEAPAAAPSAPPLAANPDALSHGEIREVLMAHGAPFNVCTSQKGQDAINAWARAGVTGADLATAVGRANQRDRDGPINPGYLDPIIKQVVSERTTSHQRDTHGKASTRDRKPTAAERSQADTELYFQQQRGAVG